MNAYIRAQVEAELGLASFIAQIYVKETHMFPKETYICAKETCVCVMHKRASLIEAEPRLASFIAQIYVKETHIFPKETYMNAYIRAQVEAEPRLVFLIVRCV